MIPYRIPSPHWMACIRLSILLADKWTPPPRCICFVPVRLKDGGTAYDRAELVNTSAHRAKIAIGGEVRTMVETRYLWIPALALPLAPDGVSSSQAEEALK